VSASDPNGVSAEESLQKFGYTQELWRTVGLTDLLFYGLIFMVPIAPFAIFGQVYSASAGMPALAYLVGAVALIFTASSYTQMVRAFPIAGSVYNYAGRSLGAPVGFLAGWMILLDYFLVPSLLYVVAAVAMNSTVTSVPVWAWMLIFVAANTAINLRGIRMTAGFIKVMIGAELAVLALFLGVGIWAVADGKGRHFSFAPLYHAQSFSWSLVFGAVSVAVLSFLGFDGISMLVEEAKGGSRQIGRAMRWALVIAGLLFVAQVWVAALLVPDPAGLIKNGDPNGTAFYDAAAVAGGTWLSKTTSTATAISWGLADTMVAQVAVARLLYAMARDRQLPRFLAKVSLRRSVPMNSTLLVAGVSTGLCLWAILGTDDYGLALLPNLVNFGALIAFLVLHLSVIVHYVVRGTSRNLLSHLVSPLIGGAILIAVVLNAKIWAQRVGGIWFAAGLLALGALYAAGRKPAISGLEAEGEPPAAAGAADLVPEGGTA
jgi:amino acid transporter